LHMVFVRLGRVDFCGNSYMSWFVLVHTGIAKPFSSRNSRERWCETAKVIRMLALFTL